MVELKCHTNIVEQLQDKSDVSGITQWDMCCYMVNMLVSFKIFND